VSRSVVVRLASRAVIVVLMLVLLPAGCHRGTRADAALSVVTLNLWHDKQDWPHRQNLIVAELQAQSPDVILLQEVLQDNGLPNQASTLAERLGYRYRFFSVDPPDRVRRYGNAVLTRAEPIATHEIKLAPLDDYRTAGHVLADIGGRRFSIYVTHLHHTADGGAVRARQVEDLLAFVAATRGDAPALIGGDFNTRADAPELQPLTDAFDDAYARAHPGEPVDAPEHGTLNTHLGHAPLRIDHVFFQGDAFRVVEARIILDRADAGGTWPSDHYGVRVDLQPR
jgi:endonuclease/exonuclease/phosphatase family metal-dependent hydrolase